MSHIIASLLGRPDHKVIKTVEQLEAKNGYPSHDVRHLADNIQRTRAKIGDLELDPDDTTGEELYHTLLVRFQEDSRKFDLQQELSGQDFNSRSAKALEIINLNIALPERWVLKSNSAKNLLRQQKPARLMKLLNYRSVESLLKREDLRQIYLIANLIEPKTWQKASAKNFGKLDSSSFELSSIRLTSLAQTKWGNIATDQPIVYDDDTGSMALIDNQAAEKMDLLSMVVLLIDSLSEFNDLNLSKEIAKLSPVLAWWSDMDGLISNLNSEPVSLNIKDVSSNNIQQLDYESRQTYNCRNSFWRELLNRYENQLSIEEDNLGSLKNQLLNVKAPINQPVFEYAEEIQ